MNKESGRDLAGDSGSRVSHEVLVKTLARTKNQHGRQVGGLKFPHSSNSSIEARSFGIPGIQATEWQKHLQEPTGTACQDRGACLQIGRDKTGRVGTDQRGNPFRGETKGRERGCGGMGLYLDKRKTSPDHGPGDGRKQRVPVSHLQTTLGVMMQSCVTFSGLTRAARVCAWPMGRVCQPWAP